MTKNFGTILTSLCTFVVRALKLTIATDDNIGKKNNTEINLINALPTIVNSSHSD